MKNEKRVFTNENTLSAVCISKPFIPFCTAVNKSILQKN